MHLNTQSIAKRITTLEARLVTGPSTEEKWATIHRSALALMSKGDVVLVQEANLLRHTGRESDYTEQHHTAVALWESVYDLAFAECDLRFSINELDDLLHSEQ